MKKGFVSLVLLIASNLAQAGIYTEFRIKTVEGLTGTMKACIRMETPVLRW